MPPRRKCIAAGDGAPSSATPPPPSSAEEEMRCDSRKLRPNRTRMATQHTHGADWLVKVYTRGRSIPRSDHADIDDLLLRFHEESGIQNLCREIRQTAAMLLEEFEHPEFGLGYRAKELIRDDTALCFYTGRLERNPSHTSRHVITIGVSEMEYNMSVDGTPVTGEPLPLGSLQLVNHSCNPNCCGKREFS